jgi:type I restriction enzyme S subunit
MSFPRYPEYKDSGVEWLGDIPAQWTVGKFRHHFRESVEKIEATVVGPMLSVSGYRGIEVKEYDDENRRRTDEELVGYRIVRRGQLVVNTMWLNYAGLGVSDHEGHVSPAYRAYFIDPRLDKRFVHHLLRCELYVQGYTRLLTGIRPNSLQMSRDDLAEFPILIPPFADQRVIAAFLDSETAKIDALVAEQERLIALLQEKRQAVISHAVTKGLNPDAPMKDSGVEWIGAIPATWSIVKLGDLVSSLTTGPFGTSLSADDYVTGGVPVINPSHIRDGSLVQEDHVTINEGTARALSRWRMQAGDIVVARRGEIGRCGLVAENEDGWLCGTGCLLVRPNQQVCISSFLRVAIGAEYSRAWLEQWCVGSTMANLNERLLASLPIGIPSTLGEQRYLIAELDERLVELQELLGIAKHTVTVLLERRLALISAAVTGQIDVRGLFTAEAA